MEKDYREKKKKGKKVFNGPVGKLIRTIGYILVFAGSFLIALETLELLNIGFINNYLIDAKAFVIDNFSQTLFDLKYAYLVVGLLLLINMLGRTLTFKIILSILLLFTTININLTGAFYFPELTNKIISVNVNTSSITTLLNKTVNASNIAILIVNILTPLSIYIMIASKKPKRIASNLLSAALILLSFYFFIHSLPSISNVTFFNTQIFITIKAYILAGTFVIATFGSAFGVLGLFRR